MGIKKAKTSVSEYIGKVPQTDFNKQKQSNETLSNPTQKTVTKPDTTRKALKTTNNQINMKVSSKKTSDQKLQIKINFRINEPKRGVCKKYDLITDTESKVSAMSAITTLAMEQFNKKVLDQEITEVKTEYETGDFGFQTSRKIDLEVFNQLKALFDPHGIKKDFAICNLIARAALCEYFEMVQ